MSHDSLVNLLNLIAQILIIVVIPVALSLYSTIKAHIEAVTGKNNYELAETFIKNVVHYLDQTYPELAGEKKFIMAAQAINDKFGDKLTSKEVEQLIEAAVKQMNISLGKTTTTPALKPENPTV